MISANNYTRFQLLTSDWISNKTCQSKLVLECLLEECIETTVDLYPDKIVDMKGKGTFLLSVNKMCIRDRSWQLIDLLNF